MKPHVLFYLYFLSPDMDPPDDTYTALNLRTRSPDYDVSPSHNQADNCMDTWMDERALL